MIGSVYFLALAVRSIPIGTGYAVWTGIGAVGVAILGMILFDEPARCCASFPSFSSLPASRGSSWSLHERPTVRIHRDPRKAEYESGKLAKRIRRQVGEAIADFNMIQAGDKVMVCLSGGKDSHGLLDVLISLQTKAPVEFELIAVNLDQKQPGFPSTCCRNISARAASPSASSSRTLTRS